MMACAFKKNQQKSNSRKSQTLINSPVVKRLHNRPVALQGWLQKRGSDGLMLWKKRWFVLSDYCLFYYKDTVEEKLLGSLILASYEISPCSPDEKGYKKYSFKAEHANMRTYYFAAENQLLMDQWTKALTLASVLEENISCEKIGQDLQTYQQSNNQGVDFRSSPNDMGIVNSEKPVPQPVYANAPPKPKRLNESSSPECSSDLQFREDNFQNYQNHPYHLAYNSPNQNQQLNMLPARQAYNYEQRPPDSYARSNIIQSATKQSNHRIPQDQYTGPLNIPKDNSHSSKNVSFSFPPRPHSVDFLDYKTNYSSNMGEPESRERNKLNCRPKSSLSTVNTNEGEANHWSAEEYARKMRQSSMYVKPTGRRHTSANTSNSSQTSLSNAEKQIFSNTGVKTERGSSVNYRTHKPGGHDKHFSRSASARLFRPTSDLKDDMDVPSIRNTQVIGMQPDNNAVNKDTTSKVQQKEESMKRLMEWKQRMLQSPLTRKPHSNSAFMPDRHSSYATMNKTDTYLSGSTTSSGSRNEKNSESIIKKDLAVSSEKSLMPSASDVFNKPEGNLIALSPTAATFYHFPSDDDGVEHPKEDIVETQKDIEKVEKPTPTNVNAGLIASHEQDQGQSWNLKVSAGELLGRTHEELVLLLIQLRRQRAAVCQSMEKCHREIEAKACLADLDKTNRLEHLQKLDELKVKLADLEKQYEKGKPLVNLVDNMVKLGSLYQAGSPQKLEFIQRIQEQRLLAEERRDWERIRPDHHELKAKVERLYRLDKLLQEESGTLHSLQQDKGVLERALGGLRNKLQGIHGNSPETEWYKRQQRLLERELSRVRSILALNSKKLEETVAENARLEQELVVLRQKLQHSRRTAEPGGANTAALEAELCRVQLLVGNLLRQRQELSLQVRQLTEKSNSLSRQIWPNSPDHQAESYMGRKQLSNGWIETDLDADVTNDIATLPSPSHSIRHQPAYVSPLYVNTTDRESVTECFHYQDELFDESPLSARSPECRMPESYDEEAFKQAYGLHLKEKPQEIKTVRIVKRESERRQRDRDRCGNIGIPITYTNPRRPIADDRLNEESKGEKDFDEVAESDYKPNEPPPTPGPRTDSVNAVWNMVRKSKMKGKLICKTPLERGDSLAMQTDSPQLSPVYLSETARKIVEEVAWQGMGEKRLVPKEKRRHHTMSGPSLIAPQNLFSQMGSRDDLDIERVLRPRLTTPDVVRSTLIRVDPHYTKETIDNILGAPGKILIPERYIPESQPELTKEEQNKRSKKADAIRKMLCETSSVPPKDSDSEGLEKTSSLKRKVAEEKKNREHLLQLSQILAQQVMEKSKIVAGGNPTALE